MPTLAEALRPELPSLAEEIIEAIRDEVAAYRRPLKGEFGRNVRVGVEFALGRFLDEQAGERGAPGVSREVYVELGRGEFREGRSLDALLSAYRTGARVAWRRCVDAGKAAGVDPDVLYSLGEAMFAYIDGLSAESTEGYAEAQSAAAGERARERRRLVGLLLQSPPPDEHSIAAAAGRSGWAVPERLAVLVADVGDPEALASRLGTGVIATETDGGTLAVVPDPSAPRRRAQLAQALGDVPAALGSVVAPADAVTSADRARLALRLLLAGVVPGPFAVADEHLPVLVLHADRRLAGDLAETALQPLDGLTGKPREKLEATLRAWLDHRGRVEETAAALDVHPQTVRYRLNQLRERFGGALDDPDGRFALELALRVR
jgi:PucR C-terminal helix-turn-helix domain